MQESAASIGLARARAQALLLPWPGLAWPGLSIWLTWPEAGSGKGRRGTWQLSACYADKILFAITIVAAAAVAAFVGNC